MKKIALIILLAVSFSELLSQDNRSFEPCYTPNALDASKGRANIEADIPFYPYDNAKPYDSHKGKGEVGYYYAASKPCSGVQPITKPIIIIDGFDPGDKPYPKYMVKGWRMIRYLVYLKTLVIASAI